MYETLRPLLFRLDAETAHNLTLQGLSLAQRGGLARCVGTASAGLPTRAFGIDFPNPVGLAAGLDKNGAHVDALATLGFGFIEVGTVTPRAQPGNPRPRLFRLPAQESIINRMGFNNDGVDALVRNLERTRWRGVLGINIGRNKDTPNADAVHDYLLCLKRVYPLASYITINISSPNTKGLRDLQQGATLQRFLATLQDARENLATKHGARKPMLVKIAPDLDHRQIDDIGANLLESGVDGVICTNTTIDRTVVAGAQHAAEAGGLSGAVLFDRSTAILRAMAERLEARIPIIGVGGISTPARASGKIKAGATLVQLYSGLIYRGPRFVADCVEAIRQQQIAST